MIPDAFQLVQSLAQSLGRSPTLEELLMYASQDPAGTPVGPPSPVPPSLRSAEHGDGPLTDQARALDLVEANPELLRIREDLVRRLLFGCPPERPGIGYGPPPARGNPGGTINRGPHLGGPLMGHFS